MKKETDTPGSEVQAMSAKPQVRRGRAAAILAVALLLSLVCNLVLGIWLWQLKQHTKEMDATYSESYFYFDSLTVDSFKAKVAAKEEFIVLITRPSCSNCAALERPFIEYAQQRGIADKVYLLNVVMLHKDADAWVLFKKTYELEGTPTYARFAEGKLVSNVGWTYENSINFSMVEEWFAAQEDFFAK